MILCLLPTRVKNQYHCIRGEWRTLNAGFAWPGNPFLSSAAGKGGDAWISYQDTSRRRGIKTRTL